MAGRGASAFPRKNKTTCVTHRIADPKERAGVAECLSEGMEETKRNEVYGKYLILDAFSGAPKKGKYFVLKINSRDKNERIAVRQALQSYVQAHEKFGNFEYAKNLCKLVKGGR